jgi:hypothetical protein
MRTPHSTLYRFAPETIAQANKVPVGTVNEKSHKLGMEHGEPLIVMMDSLIKYAEAYRERFNTLLADDYFMGEQWLQAARAVRALLNGDGVVAWKKDRSTDSKDNGAIEGMFWDAMSLAGFKEEDV